VFANYVGFWLFGVMLVAVSMIGSQLTGNATIAFILSIIACALVVYLGTVLKLARLPQLGDQRHLRPVRRVRARHAADLGRAAVPRPDGDVLLPQPGAAGAPPLAHHGRGRHGIACASSASRSARCR
jgi:hypothetical protein